MNLFRSRRKPAPASYPKRLFPFVVFGIATLTNVMRSPPWKFPLVYWGIPTFRGFVAPSPVLVQAVPDPVLVVAIEVFLVPIVVVILWHNRFYFLVNETF